MKKEKFWTVAFSENGADTVEAVKANGYTLETEIDGKAHAFGVRRDELAHASCQWTVTDVWSGLRVDPGHKFKTRKEAVAYVGGEKDGQTGKTIGEIVGGYIEKNGARYAAQCDAFVDLVANGKPMERNRYAELVRSAELKRETLPDATEDPSPVSETAAAVTLAAMREWVKDKPSLRVEVAGSTPEKQAKNPIWVCGPSKEFKEELMGMGFRWGKSKTFGKGWHYDPDRQTA